MQPLSEATHLHSHQARPFRRHETLWHWIAFCLMLATVPAFYLELASTDLQFQHLGQYIYLLVSAVITLWLIHAFFLQKNRQNFFSQYGLELLIALGAAATGFWGSQNTWSQTEWILRSIFSGLVLIHIMISLRGLFSPTGTIYLLILGMIMLALSGGGFYWLEPTVHSYAEGLWLSFTSGATVGYGDIVPTTPASRVFAVFMVVLGYALLSLVTASIAAVFIGVEEKALRREMHHDIKHLSHEVAALRTLLEEKHKNESEKNTANLEQ